MLWPRRVATDNHAGKVLLVQCSTFSHATQLCVIHFPLDPFVSLDMTESCLLPAVWYSVIREEVKLGAYAIAPHGLGVHLVVTQ